MQRYLNRNGESGVLAYELGPDWIAVKFAEGAVYRYDAERPGRSAVAEMKRMAEQGQGLSSYNSRVVQKNYAKKLR